MKFVSDIKHQQSVVKLGGTGWKSLGIFKKAAAKTIEL